MLNEGVVVRQSGRRLHAGGHGRSVLACVILQRSLSFYCRLDGADLRAETLGDAALVRNDGAARVACM
jgi:hypothetical protein